MFLFFRSGFKEKEVDAKNFAHVHLAVCLPVNNYTPVSRNAEVYAYEISDNRKAGVGSNHYQRLQEQQFIQRMTRRQYSHITLWLFRQWDGRNRNLFQPVNNLCFSKTLKL